MKGAPAGGNATLTIADDETQTVSRLKELIGATFGIEDSSGIVMLVGFPPSPLVAEDVTPVANVLRDGEVIVIKQASIPPAVTEVSIRGQRRYHPSVCPPGIEEETWENLDEETKRELSFSFHGEDDGDEGEIEEIEKDEYAHTLLRTENRNEEMNDVDVNARRLAELHNNMRQAFQQTAMASSNTRSSDASRSIQKKSAGGVSFGARVATLSSNGQASAVSRTSFGPGSQPRTFGARVATLPKNLGGG